MSSGKCRIKFNMPYVFLADIVVLAHLLWIVFLFTGAYWGRKYIVIGILHFSGLLYSLVIQVFNWDCLLTTLEYALREKAFRETGSYAGAYTGSFISHYAQKIVYLNISRGFIFAATLLLIGVNIWLYLRKPKNK